jgi:tRNA A-37 threonylcarbamoyl transferase component Bud32
VRSPLERDALVDAANAEKMGDVSRAVQALRAHLGRHADDVSARLRLAQLLVTLDERRSAREVLRVLDAAAPGGGEAPTDALARTQANRLLAELDEVEGALTSAHLRWERILADDIDDPQARARLEALRPAQDHWPTGLSLGTLVSPEGIRTARFTLLRELGRGATAAVYLVRDERLALPLALKVLHPQLAAAARAGARARFFAEARLAARLRHPGVVAVYDVDEETRSLAMEYVAGGTLRDRLRGQSPPDQAAAGAAGGAGGAPPPAQGSSGDEILATARSLLEALGYVHEAGVVHGDLKPGNVLLRRRGQAVLADFGTAQLAAAAVSDERPAGTPLYLAPEQLRGQAASPLTDLYAAGAILWEAVAGRPLRRQRDLFTASEAPAPPLPPQALAALGAAGARVAPLIAALLATDPAARPASARAAAAALLAG